MKILARSLSISVLLGLAASANAQHVVSYFNFNNLPLGNSGSDRSLATRESVGGQGLTNFSVGRVNSELGFGGLVLSASSESVSILIRALKESRRLEILSGAVPSALRASWSCRSRRARTRKARTPRR